MTSPGCHNSDHIMSHDEIYKNGLKRGHPAAHNNDICHYKGEPRSINISTMLKHDTQDIELFKDLNEYQLKKLDFAFEPFRFSRHIHIFEQGDSADYLYILTSGKVIILYKPYDGPEISVATISAGGVFGWSTALGRKAYSSGALAAEDCKGYRISKTSLSELCEDHPETSAAFMKQLASLVNNPMDPSYNEILKIITDGMNHNGNCDQRKTKNGRRDSPIQHK